MVTIVRPDWSHNVDIQEWIWRHNMYTNHLGRMWYSSSYNYSHYPISKTSPAYLKIIYDHRDPNHSGWCSDPDKDVGEPVLKDFARYDLSDFQLMELRPYIKKNQLDLRIAKLLFDNENIGCNMGSGYCYYKGYIRVRSVKVSIDASETSIEEICAGAFNTSMENPLTTEEYVRFFEWNRQNQINGWLYLVNQWRKSTSTALR